MKSGPYGSSKKSSGLDNKVVTRRKNAVRQIIKNSKPTEPVTKGLSLGKSNGKSEQFKNRLNPDAMKLINKALKVNPKSKTEILNFRNNIMKKGR